MSEVETQESDIHDLATDETLEPTLPTTEATDDSRRVSDERIRLLEERMKNPVRLGKIPSIALKDSPALDAHGAERIRTLISALSEIDRPDYGFSPTMSGDAFLPVSDQSDESAFLLTDHGLTSSSALRDLVSLGPDSLPFLLKSLDDKTPTKIRLEHGGGFGAMWFDREMDRNPLNPLEAKTLTAEAESSARQQQTVSEFSVKIGDICFVAIGQITGRSYQAVRYQPTACIVINSPTHDSELAAKVREIWSSAEPREFLFQSLLRDYS